MPPKLPSREYGSKPSNKNLSPGKQIYDYDHYSGANVSLYIGDIWVDEVTSIKYQIEQQKRPIYGYASYHWDFVAKGTSMVTGMFTINFKESGYLYYVLKRIQDAGANAHLTPTELAEGSTSQTNPIDRNTIERFLEKPLDREKYKDIADIASLPDEKFENYAEQFEDTVWGKTGETLDSVTSTEHRRVDHMDSFDIFIVYGNMDDQTSNHTVKRIQKVELVGQSQLVEVSGEPIQEAYTFLARDVV